MKSNKRLLSILLVFLMMISTLGNVPIAFADTEGDQAVSETTGTELQGEVIGDKEVFHFTMPEQAQGQPEEVLALRSAGEMRPLGAPVSTDDTTVTIQTEGLDDKPFNWTALPNNEFKLKAKWETIDGQKHEQELPPINGEDWPVNSKEKTFTYDVGWPTDGTMVGVASLETDFNQNIDVRVFATSSTSNGNSGKLLFTIKLTELAESRAKVEYLDPYGRPLEGNDLPSAGNVLQVTADELHDVAVKLPLTSGQINMRSDSNIDEDELHDAKSGLTYKVDGKTNSQEVEIDGKKYKLDISAPSAKEIATIKLVYEKDVIQPPVDNEGNQPKPPAKGYVRVTFDPTNEAENPTKTYYDVKENLSWADAKNENLTPHVAEPQAPTANDQTKKFIAWKDGEGQTLADKTGTVAETTFTAKFGADIIPFDPNDEPQKPDEDAYVTITLDPNQGGSFAAGTKTKFHVRKTYTVKASDFDTAKAALTPKANTVFKEWAEKNGNDYISFPAAGKTYGSDATVYATYRGDKDIIPFDPKNPNDPDKDKPDGPYVTVTLDANGGEFEPGTKTAFHVKKTYNVTVGDFKKALDKLHPPDNYAFKEWAEKEGNSFNPFSPNGKTFEADGKVYATYRDDSPIIPIPDPNHPIPRPSNEYVKVSFDATDEGKFDQGEKEKHFWVKTGVTTREVKAQVTTNPTFKDTNAKKVFENWMDNGAVATFDSTAVGTSDKTYTATYRDDRNIIPFDPNDPSEPNKNNSSPNNYVEVIFDATNEGQFDQGKQEKHFWVKKTVTTKAVKDKLNQEPTFKDTNAKKVFENWMENNAPATFDDKKVGENDRTYEATYRDNRDIIPIPDADHPIPKPSGDYVKVSFDATKDGQFDPGVQTKAFWVKKTITTKAVKDELNQEPTFKDNNAKKVFDKWMDNNGNEAIFDGTTVGDNDKKYVATYRGERDIIPFDPNNPRDPDKDEPHGSYVRVDLNANGGTFKAGTKSAFWVKTTYPVKTSDFKQAQDALTPPSGQAFKEWAQKENNVFKTFPVAGKTYQKDDTVYAIYKNAGGGGSSGGGPAPTPTPEKKDKPDSKLNVVDHYAYMVGYPDKTFRANTQMTRAEVTMMFARLFKDRPVGTPFTPNRYRDVVASNWYAYAVDYMSEQNIVSGYPDGTFKPNAPITRAEFAAMAARFDKLTDAGNSTFTDVSAKHWASKVIAQAASKNWVSGYPDGTFKPNQNITRVEVVSSTNRILNRYADLAFAKAHKSELAPMVDIAESHWGYGAIVEAMNGHDYIRQADGKTEKWEKLNGKAFTFPTPLAS